MKSWPSAQGLRTEEIEKLFHDAKENGEATINVSVPRMGKRRVMGFFIAVLGALTLITSQYYTDKMIWGPSLWYGFWIFPMIVGVWLIATILLNFRKGP